jgi:hypothetical protein
MTIMVMIANNSGYISTKNGRSFEPKTTNMYSLTLNQFLIYQVTTKDNMPHIETLR